jgi:hypothetical protein
MSSVRADEPHEEVVKRAGTVPLIKLVYCALLHESSVAILPVFVGELQSRVGLSASASS